MFSARKSAFRFLSAEDLTIVAEIRLPFRFIIFMLFATSESMNFWEVHISLLRRYGAEFSFFSGEGINDQVVARKVWDGNIVKPVETPECKMHDDGNALWCSPFEPEDDDEPKPNTLNSSQVNWRCIDEIDWQAEKAKDDRAMAIGDPQPGNTVDVLDQVRQVMQDIDDFGGALPY